MKIATFNANSIRSRIEPIRRWLNAHQPDVLAVQETKVQDEDFPVDALLKPAGCFSRRKIQRRCVVQPD